MTFAERFERIFHRLLPAPFTIAVILTLFTIIAALLFTVPHTEHHIFEVLGYWEKGIWDPPLLVFMVQMMLILVLGHILALSPGAKKAIDYLTAFASTPAKAAWLVTFSTLVVAFFNWGLGLIFGAIISRKTGEKFSQQGSKLNYPLIGAAGYSGLMVWHGGISGSAPIKVVEKGHIRTMMQGIIPDAELRGLPETISFEDTIFGPMNIMATVLLLIILPLTMAWLARKTSGGIPVIKTSRPVAKEKNSVSGAERLDYSKRFCYLFAILILGYAVYIPFSGTSFNLNFITPNYINFVLLGLGLLLHGSFSHFLDALDEAIGGASGILVQFPLYFGIMGIMKYSGLVNDISSFFISISNTSTFPLFTFLSAGLVNIFVPSGGGQWSIQGPVIVQAAQQLGVSLPKSIMAMAYGDQLTNMLQPFWALPLLAVTGLKAREILPYTLVLLLSGTIIFTFVLLLF